MKIRKIENGEVQWFGQNKLNSSNQKVYTSPFLEIKTEEDYIEAYKYRIYNLLKIIKGELPDKTYGIKGVFGKQSKGEIDVEIQEALRTKLDLVINYFTSVVVDRDYELKFTVTTPKGISITMETVL